MELAVTFMNIGRLSNDDGESNKNVSSYQNEWAFCKNLLAFISILLKWQI